MAKQKYKDRAGYVLDGKYEIISEKGHGGMSVVWIAKDNRLQKLWAVKEFLSTDARVTKANRESLRKEAELLKKLDHPSFVRIVDIIEADDALFVVMDYVDGEDLRKVMKRYGGPIPVDTVAGWGKQLCRALDYLHTPIPAKDANHEGKGIIVFRDLKPDNIMLRDDGALRLIDFGIAREYKEGNKGDTIAGWTPGFSAPEQVNKSKQSDPRSDIYALGMTMHYLLTGVYPDENIYNPKPIREYNAQLPEGLERIIVKCTQFEPDDRYANCKEVLYDLEHYDKLTAQYQKRQKAKLRNFGLLAGACVVCFVVGAAGLLLSNAEKQSTYDSYMREGDQIALVSGTADNQRESQKVEYYKQAILVDPGHKDPYANVLDVLVNDGEFSSEDADEYYKLLDGSAQGACSKEDYSSLCYNFANVYFSYTTNYAQASMWFANAVNAGGLSDELMTNANTYIAISDFRSNLSSKEKLNTLDSSEPYVTYWNELCAAFDNVVQAQTTPHSVLKVSELIVDACSSEAYTLPFKNGGIAQNDLDNRIKQVREQVKSLDGAIVSAADRELYNYVLLHCDGGIDEQGITVEPASAVIGRTYSNATVTAKQTDAALNSANGGEGR